MNTLLEKKSKIHLKASQEIYETSNEYYANDKKDTMKHYKNNKK